MAENLNIKKKQKMVLHYLKTSFREMLKYKTQSIINIIGLTIAFASFALSGYWYYWEHHFDNFHPEWKNTYAITTTGLFKTSTGQDGEINQLHKMDAEILTDLPQVLKTTRLYNSGIWTEIKNVKQRINGYLIDSVFFDIFHSKFIEGNIFKLPYNGEFMVLTESTAKRLFGTVDCVGEVIKYTNRNEAQVAAVMKDYPDNTELLFDYLVLTARENIWNNRSRAKIYVTVANNQDAAILRKNIEHHKSITVDPYGVDQPQRWRFNLRSLQDVHFTCNHSLEERFRNIYILFFTGILLLVCALMNNLVLFIGRQQHKLKKNITYTSLGETPFKMFLRYMVSLLLPILIAYILSVGLIEVIFPLFDNFTAISHEGMMLDYTNRMTFNHLLTNSMMNTGAILVVYLVIALIPVFHFMRFSDIITNNPVVGLRRILITGQIFIGSIFLIISVCLYKQLSFIKETSKGIQTENIVQIYLGEFASSETDSDLLKTKLMQQPGIMDITMTVDPVLISDGMFNHIGILWVEGRDGEEMRANMERDNFMYVERNFPVFFGLTIIDGRFLDENDTFKYMVNETAFRDIGLENLFERTVHGNGRVVGVVNDYHYAPMKYPIQPVVYTFLTEEQKKYDSYKYLYVKLESASHNEVLKSIKSILKEFDKGEISEDHQLIWLEDIQKSFNKPEETIFFLFSLFSLLCVLISSFGIYSLVALSAEQRKREIAIRKVNGALLKDILSIFLKEYLILVIIGNAIALPLGYVFIHHWLETYAYRTNISIGLFFLVFLITIFIVILAVWRQVRVAIRVNPAETIKTE